MQLLPFRILGLQQIALGSLEKAKLRRLWCEFLGIEKVHQYQSQKENVDEDILYLGQGHNRIEIDLMQPIDPQKSPKVHQPPLNHIGLWVDDLQVAVEYLDAKGVRFAPGGVRKGASGHDVCFIHPRPSEDKPYSGEGVLIELVQAPESMITESKS